MKNIQEKKLRSVLIIISITLSSALFFSTSALSKTLERMFEERLKQYVGTAEIGIYPKQADYPLYYNNSIFNKYIDMIDYAIGAIETTCVYRNADEEINIWLRGMNYHDLRKLNPVIFLAHENMDHFKGKKIIIGTQTASRYNLDIGDKMNLVIKGIPLRFSIAGIAASEGLFLDDGRNYTAVIPIEILEDFFAMRGKLSVIHIKSRDPGYIPVLLDEFTDAFSRYTVREHFSKTEMKSWMEERTSAYKIMFVIVLLTSVFIIYTSFQVLITERLPVIGTFRSIGATRKMTDGILLAESLSYGIIGSIAGCVLGVFILRIMTRLSVSRWLGLAAFRIDFTFFHIIYALFLGIGLSFASSLIPIIRVSRIPVKNIILNIYKQKRQINIYKNIFGFAALCTGLIVPHFIPGQAALVVDTLCILLIISGAALLVPGILYLFSHSTTRFIQCLFGNIGNIAVKNLKGSKNIRHTIVLLTIGLSGLFLIMNTASGVQKNISAFYKDAAFDIWMSARGADRLFESRLRTVDGIIDTHGVYTARSIKVTEYNKVINTIIGVDKTVFSDYWNFTYSGDSEFLLKTLDNGRNIILNYTLKRRFDIQAGDSLTLEFPKRKRVYRVIGFFHSLMNMGNVALISKRHLKLEIGSQYYGEFYVKTDENPEKVVKSIREKFSKQRPWAESLMQIEANTKKSYDKIFYIMQGFAALALFIGTIGIINNFLISFIERKRILSLLRSVGMSLAQCIKMLLLEAFFIGFIGSLIGIITGFCALSIIPGMMNALEYPPMTMYYSLPGIALFLFAGIILTMIASSGPAYKSSKINLIMEIKYE